MNGNSVVLLIDSYALLISISVLGENICSDFSVQLNGAAHGKANGVNVARGEYPSEQVVGGRPPVADRFNEHI